MSYIIPNKPFEDANTGLILATANTQSSSDIAIHMNYLDIIKLNNPSNIRGGKTLFGITGTNDGSTTPAHQAGVVIHDGDSTTIIPFYNEESALKVLTWTASSTGVAFSDGQEYIFKGGLEGTSVHGLSIKDDNTVDTGDLTINGSGGVLEVDQIVEYWVVYGDPLPQTSLTYKGVTYTGNKITVSYDYTRQPWDDGEYRRFYYIIMNVDGTLHKISWNDIPYYDDGYPFEGYHLVNSNKYIKYNETVIVPTGTEEILEIPSLQEWINAGTRVQVNRHSSTNDSNPLYLVVSPAASRPTITARNEMYGSNAEGLDYSCVRVYADYVISDPETGTGEIINGSHDGSGDDSLVVAFHMSNPYLQVWYYDYSVIYDIPTTYPAAITVPLDEDPSGLMYIDVYDK